MQKKLIALAVASVLAVPLAAQAGVEIYGQARMSLDFSSNNDPGVGQEDSAIAVSSNRSRLGFRGDEDLGGGLKALWQFEQQVNFDTSTWGAARRDAFVGLNGAFGTVMVGRMITPYKISTIFKDIFISSRGDHNAILGYVNTPILSTTPGAHQVHFNNRLDNSINYMTPSSLAPFSARVAYSVNNKSDDLPMSTADSERDAFSLNGVYEHGPLFVTAAYESLNAVTPVPGGTDDATAFKLGANYTLGGMTTLGAIWESADRGGANGDRDAIYLSVAHKLDDAITLKAAFTMADEVGGAANTGATHTVVGASYAFSKTTEAYALYSTLSNDSAAHYALDGLMSVPGEDVSSFSVGLNHVFSSK